jgi:hypothetical protein
MYRIIRTIAAVSLSLLATHTVAQNDGDWTVLIEGNQGLDNFNQVGDANWHSASDFIHVNRGEGVAYLVTPDSYDDFELHIEFMASEDANSGIYMRCQDAMNITDRSCYEANIFDQRPDPAYGTGAIVHVAAVTEPYPKAAGQWNTYAITLQGDHLRVILNGEVTADVRDSQFREGPIALQWGRGDLRFRSFRIRSL